MSKIKYPAGKIINQNDFTGKQFGVIHKNFHINIQISIHKDVHCSIIYDEKLKSKEMNIFQSLKYLEA